MIKSLQQSFIFLSQVIGIPVVDFNTNKKVGRVGDIVVSLKEMYPKATSLVISQGFFKKKRLIIGWKNIQKIIGDRAVFIINPQEAVSEPEQLLDNEILLRDTFWDKQIVDISGSKVVRVNDLHLLKEDRALWVVHMDIGFTGLVRRLGCINIVQFLVRLVSSYQQ